MKNNLQVVLKLIQVELVPSSNSSLTAPRKKIKSRKKLPRTSAVEYFLNKSMEALKSRDLSGSNKFFALARKCFDRNADGTVLGKSKLSLH